MHHIIESTDRTDDRRGRDTTRPTYLLGAWSHCRPRAGEARECCHPGYLVSVERVRAGVAIGVQDSETRIYQ